MDESRAKELIRIYGLCPHPEGGHYKEVYRSADSVASLKHSKHRAAVTHIYFLLTKGEISRFHRVLHDEIWNFYDGAPLRLITFDGTGCRDTMIGPGQTDFCAVIKGGDFQAAQSTGDYSLVGCTVAPGFDFKDFSFLSDTPDQKRLLVENHPKFKRFL